MMKKLLIGILIFGISFSLALAVLMLADLNARAAEPARIQLIVSVPTTVSDVLPTGCIETNGSTDAGATCVAWLGWAWAIQANKVNHLRLDLWARVQDKYYHAHALRKQVGSNWVWHIYGPRVWFELFKKWKQSEPSIGLYQFHDVLTNATLCNQLAPAWLSHITLDSGARYTRPPMRHSCNEPTDAGPGDCTITPRPWPDGSTVQCASANWWHVRSRHGGPIPQRWSPASDAGYGASTGAVRRGGPTIQPPDARVSKTCYNVPVGTACP